MADGIYTGGISSVQIDDIEIALKKVWSSSKVNEELQKKVDKPASFVNNNIVAYSATLGLIDTGFNINQLSKTGHSHVASSISIDTTNFGKNLGPEDDNMQKIADKIDDLDISGGGGGAVNSVNGKVGDVVLNADDISDTTSISKYTTAGDISKLAGIEAGATANDTDANLKNRTNHTGTQTADTITQGATNDIVTITEKKALIANLSSGLKTGGIVTANATNPNNIDITAGEGIVIDNTDPLNPVFTRVTWPAQTDVVLTNIASEPITNLYFDKFGVLQQGTLANINTTRRQNVLIGVVEHIFSPNIESIDNISALPFDTYVNLDEFSSTLGRIKSNTFSTTGLNINLSAGVTFGIGDNKDSQNPNFKNFVAQNTVSFVTTYKNGVGGWAYGASTTVINNTQYDNGTGTLATLANNKATVHLLFWNPLANTFFLQIGQNEYANIDTAKSNYLSDVQEINPLLGNIIFLGVIGITKSATTVGFSQNSDKLGQLGIGGGSGAAATDLQSSYNVSLPSAEIETNTTNGALSLKGGTGVDTNDVLEIKNNAGTITASVQANGTPTKGTDLITKAYADANYNGGGGVENTKSTLTAGQNLLEGDAIRLGVSPEDTTRMYKADGSDNTKVNFIGFADTAITSGAAGDLVTAGVKGNFSGLIPGAEYYLASQVKDLFNISSPVDQGSLDYGSGLVIYGTAISSDGLNYYLCDFAGDRVYQYPLSTAFDITTAGASIGSVNIGDNFGAGIFLSPDGTELYIAAGSANTIRQYTLSTPFSITTATFTQSIGTGGSSPQGVCLNNDGTKLYIAEAGGDTIRGFTLSTPYDISTASFDNNLSVSAQTTQPCSCYISDDGTKMFLTGISDANTYQYNLSTPFDISTGTFSTSFSITGSGGGMTIGDNGSRLYKVNEGTQMVYQYDIFSLVNAPGVISTDSTSGVKVGKAISATELKIFTGGQSAGGGSVTTLDTLEIAGTQNIGVVSSYRVSQDGTLSKFSAYLENAPTGSSFTVDLKINGITQATVTITAGSNSGITTTFTSSTLTEGDLVTYEITAVGNNVAGAGLTLALNITKNV